MIEFFSADDRPLLIFLPNLKYGGAEKVLVSIANETYNSGRRIRLIVAHATGELKEDVAPGIELICLSKKRVIYSIIPLLREVLKSGEVHLFTTMYHCNVICAFVKLLLPSIRLTIRESTSIDFYKNTFSPLKFKIFRILSKLFYPIADTIIFPSSDMLTRFQEFCSLPNNKCKHLPNPIDGKSIDVLSREPIPTRLWSRRAKKVIINVGRMDKNKNQIAILYALEKLKHYDLELLLVGDGPEYSKLQAASRQLRIEDKVTFLGFQKNPFNFMKEADIFVLSSFSEGYPNVLVQACHLGLSIVSTDCPTGPREILSNYKKSHIVKADSAELSAAIENFLKETNL